MPICVLRGPKRNDRTRVGDRTQDRRVTEAAQRSADTQFDTLSRETRRTLVDYSAYRAIKFEYANGSGGLSRTAQVGHGIQKVGGSTPPGSTNFEFKSASSAITFSTFIRPYDTQLTLI